MRPQPTHQCRNEPTANSPSTLPQCSRKNGQQTIDTGVLHHNGAHARRQPPLAPRSAQPSGCPGNHHRPRARSLSARAASPCQLAPTAQREADERRHSFTQRCIVCRWTGGQSGQTAVRLASRFSVDPSRYMDACGALDSRRLALSMRIKYMNGPPGSVCTVCRWWKPAFS